MPPVETPVERRLRAGLRAWQDEIAPAPAGFRARVRERERRRRRAQLSAAAGLVAAAAVAAVAAWTVPGRRLVPYWGRAGDLLHTGVAIALIPLALAATGVYHLIRGISG